MDNSKPTSIYFKLLPAVCEHLSYHSRIIFVLTLVTALQKSYHASVICKLENVIWHEEQMTSYGPGPTLLQLFVANGQLPLYSLHSCSWTLSFLAERVEVSAITTDSSNILVLQPWNEGDKCHSLSIHPSIHPYLTTIMFTCHSSHLYLPCFLFLCHHIFWCHYLYVCLLKCISCEWCCH